MPDLSPATARIAVATRQAFDDRYELLGGFDDNWQELCIAAAFRALAARIHTLPAMVGEGGEPRCIANAIRQDILDIAFELETQ